MQNISKPLAGVKRSFGIKWTARTFPATHGLLWHNLLASFDLGQGCTTLTSLQSMKGLHSMG